MRSVMPAERIGSHPSATLPPRGIERPASQPDSPDSFAQVMRNLATRVDQGESVVSHALQGNPYDSDAKGMIALQAGVYRYVEAVDLVSRLVDRATGAVKTTLQNQ